MKNKIRTFIWKILGINYYKYLKNIKNVSLKDASWVKIGLHTYDNGAYVWRWYKKSELIIGNYCSIANDVHFICDSGYHTESEVSNFPFFNELLDKKDSITINKVTYKISCIIRRNH